MAMLESMQARIEYMHAHWGNKTFLKKPTLLKHHAELEHALMVDPPPGVPAATGWVPVSIEEVYESKNNVETGLFEGGY